MPRGVPRRARQAASAQTAAETSARPDPRPAMRAEDPRARAAARAAQLREHQGDQNDGADKFYVDPHDIPEGWDYEWKRVSTLGKADPSYEVATARAGWEPVPAERHPAYMPTGGTYSVIERDGLVLMERPREITDEARARDQKAARAQMRQKEAQLSGNPDGHFERTNKDQSMVSVKKSFEHVPIPD
jgi:hypothetical protein